MCQAANNLDSDTGYSEGVRGAPMGTPRDEAGVSELQSGRCKSEDEGAGRRKNEAMQLGREICGKTPNKGTGKLGRLGQVLWDSPRPSEGEASSLLMSLKKTHGLFVFGNKVSFSPGHRAS